MLSGRQPEQIGARRGGIGIVRLPQRRGAAQECAPGTSGGRTWSGRVVLVTGGSQGIGRAVALAAAARGADVALLARDREALAEVHLEVATLAARTSVHVADVVDPGAVKDATAEVTAKLGLPDVLVTCAGRGAWGPALETPPEVFRDLFDVNLLGVVHTVSALAPDMVERGSGHLVVLGSIAGFTAPPGEAAYAASKFAVAGYVEALRAELAGTGVQVTLVAPGPVDTGFCAPRARTYQRRFPRPLAASQVASAILDAVDADRAEIILPAWLKLALLVRAVAPGVYRRGHVLTAPGH